MNHAATLLWSACLLTIPNLMLAQESPELAADTIEFRLIRGNENEALNQLMQFENVCMETVELQGAPLKGSAYQLWVREFREGKSVGRELLFDGTEAPLFHIKDKQLSFRMLCKAHNETLRLQMSTPRFSSRRLKFQLVPSELDYVLKDFIGSQSSLRFAVDQPMYLFAIIPPTIHADGTGSYCEVAQSGVAPEEIGTHFHLPHYFLIELKLIATE